MNYVESKRHKTLVDVPMILGVVRKGLNPCQFSVCVHRILEFIYAHTEDPKPTALGLVSKYDGGKY